MLRKFNRKVFSHISVEENEDVIDAAPEVSANGEGTYDMSTPELENEKQELVELGDGIDAGVEEIETCCDDCETVIEIDNIVKDSVDSNNGLDQTSINIINTTIENMLKRHGLSRMRFRIPSVERYGKPLDRVKQAKVALEGISDFFKWIWKKIVAIWDTICGWFRKIAGKSVNLFKKEIEEAYKKLQEVEKEKGILSENYQLRDSFINKGTGNFSKESTVCLMLDGATRVGELTIKEGPQKGMVFHFIDDPGEVVGPAVTMAKGIEKLLDQPRTVAMEINTLIATTWGPSDGNSKEDNPYAFLYEKLGIPELYYKYITKKEGFKVPFEMVGIKAKFTEAMVDKLMSAVKEVKNKADKTNEDEIDKWIKEVEKESLEEEKKKLEEKKLGEEDKKKELERIKTHVKILAESVKNFYTYIADYGHFIKALAVNIYEQIRELKEVKFKSE